MEDENNNKIVNILIVVFTIIFAFFVYITSYKVNLLMYDDAAYGCILRDYGTHNILNNFIINTSVEHYQFLAVFFSKFFGKILPDICNYHPQDFIQSFGHYIKGMFFILSIIPISYFVLLNKKKNIKLFFSTFLLIFFAVLMITMHYARDTLSLYIAFFRFQIPYLYLFGILTLVSTNYLYDRFDNKKLLILLFILNILDGNEITIFIVQIFIFLLLISLGKEKIKFFIKNNKFLTLVYLTLPILKIILSTLTNIYHDSLLKTVNYELFKAYTITFFKYIFHDHSAGFLSFFIALIIYSATVKNKKIKIITCSIIISLLTFLYSLILYGKADLYGDNNINYFLYHKHLQTNVEVILFSVTLLLIIEILYKFPKIYKKLPLILLSLAIILFGIIKIFNNDKYTFKNCGHLYYERKELYKFEKNVLCQIKKYNGTVYLKYEPTDKLDTFNMKYILLYHYIISTYKLAEKNINFMLVKQKEAQAKEQEAEINYSDEELNSLEFKNLYQLINNKTL